MTRDQEEALEAAKLAAMVGSHLRGVDQLAMDRTSVPANRINIDSFVAQVKGQPNRRPNNINSPTALQQKAMEDAMREAMMIPEPKSWTPPPADISQQMIPLPETPNQQVSYVDNSTIEILKSIDSKLDVVVNLVRKVLNQDE